MNSHDPIMLYKLSSMHHAELLRKTQAGRLLRTLATRRRASVGGRLVQGWALVWALVITWFTGRKTGAGTARDEVKPYGQKYHIF